MTKKGETQFKDSELGKIEIQRNARARRLRITIKPDHLRLTLPPYATQQEGLDFLNLMREKIKQKQQKIQKTIRCIDEKKPLKTLTFITAVQPSDREKVFFCLKNNILHIEYPKNENPCTETMQTVFRKGVDFFLRKEAKRILPSRLRQLAELHGFKYSDVKIQSSKTRWGSCSGRKSINLSYFLLTLPPHLIDYVLLHELCHTVEMNHGERFWKLMDKVTDNHAQALRREIKSTAKIN
jgi:predicted metal-dependent hydrolase